MALTLNQFGITDIKAKVVNPDKGYRYDVQNVGAGNLVPGDYVVIKHVAGSKTICVEKATAENGTIFGVVEYESAKGNVYGTGEMLTIAQDYTIITCEASGAIQAGAKVDAVLSGSKVVTHSNGSQVGVALTPATASGDLLLVRLNLG